MHARVSAYLRHMLKSIALYALLLAAILSTVAAGRYSQFMGKEEGRVANVCKVSRALPQEREGMASLLQE
ncbi:hypothetical protein PRIPAC_79801 [Pristionchus pacificus]|uniref:Uncharacterized protein n=1 Tax=Pristionchus pacificus TaxID=54126 RepID=A0A2A6BVI3_PRIPA|nr:hypothetical protein PRIPAC_79801 [Pristionchus pacificus]|eukprot:PDM69895.1 hypothetical protein PRIPAC_49107 [Pristionchus pacificus]